MIRFVHLFIAWRADLQRWAFNYHAHICGFCQCCEPRRIISTGLVEGTRRGLPYFSKGVVYLLEGRTRYRNDAERKGEADREVEVAYKLVQELALRTNMRQPFTTVLVE